MIERRLTIQAFDSPVWLWLCVALALLAIASMYLLLRSERRLVPRTIGRLLLALRLTVIAVLCVVLLEPVLSWSYDLQRQTRTLIAVDVSRSMETVDEHAGPAEKLRWARALGIIGNESTDERLDRWQAALEAGEEPSWIDANDSQAEQPQEQLAEIRRNNLEAALGEVSRLSRKEIAARLLMTTAQPLLSTVGQLGGIELAIFAGSVAPFEATALAETIANPPSELNAERSDLAAPLSLRSSDTSELTGIVLLSDGRDHTQSAALQQAAQLGSAGTRVFPVVLGSKRRPRDLSISSLDYPSDMLQGDSGTLTATLSTSGFEGEAIEILLEGGADEELHQVVTPEGPRTRVQFELDAAEKGRVDYTLRAVIQPDELREDNNSESFRVNVLDDTIAVLLIEGEARWEFRFIDNALTRDERIDVSRVVFKQPYLGVLDQTFFPRSLPAGVESDESDEFDLAAYDVVVVGDTSPDDLPADFWSRAEEYVAKEGGTLIMVAGRRHLPSAFDDPTFARLLPLTGVRPIEIPPADPETPSADDVFELRLTGAGAAEPMLKFASDETDNRDVWSSLPGHYWGLTGEPKPGAAILVTTFARRDDAAASRSPAILRQPYGLGYVFWLGIDTTWRWRRRIGDEYHHRFWGQICRWAVENKAIVGTGFVKFGPEQSQYQVGESIVVRARWSQDFVRRYPEASASVKLFEAEADSTASPVQMTMKAVAGRPHVHEARFDALPPGDYRVELEIEPSLPDTEPVAAFVRVEEPRSPELNDVSANLELLEQIAASSGGALLYPEQLSELPVLLQGDAQRKVQSRELPLWSHWSVLAILGLLLTCEWVIRKLHGLP